MVGRVPVDRQITPVVLEPQARAVDTFEAPGPSPLRGLASALSQLEGPLSSLLATRAKKAEEDAEIVGEAKFYEDNAEGVATLVADGKHPAHESPGFMKGYKKAKGMVDGNALLSNFNAAFDAWEGKSGDDPKEFDKFVAGYIASNVNTQDPQVLRGLIPAVRELHARGFARYTEFKHKQVYEGNINTHAALISQAVDAATKTGLMTPEGTDYKALFVDIQSQRAALVAAGIAPQDADEAIMDAVAAKAVQFRDEDLLTFFTEKVPGGVGTFADTPYGLKLREQAANSIEVAKRQNLTEEYTRQQRIDKLEGDRAKGEIQDVLSANPGAPIPEELLTRARKYEPTIQTQIAGWREDLNRGFTDNKALQQVTNEIILGGGRAAVLEAQRRGVFGRKEDLTAMLELADKMERDGVKLKIEDALKDDQSQQFLKQFDVMTKGRTELGDPIAGISKDGLEAQFDFRRALSEWSIANPNATYMERQEYIQKLGKSILDRIEPADEMNPMAGEGSYNREEVPEAGVNFTNPYTEDEEKGAAADAEMDEDVATMLGGLKPEQRAQLEKTAKERGFTVEELVKEMMQTTTKSIPAKPEQRSEAVDGEARFQNASLVAAQPRGMAALVSSSKRGGAPDLENLRPQVVSGVTSLQEAFGKPLPIVSGFRGEARNAQAGGAKKSQHKHGNAVDIDVSDMPRAERLRLIKMASEQGFTGIGVYDNSIHLDYGGRRSWGPTHGKESVPGWASGAISEHMARKGGPSPMMRQPGQTLTPEAAMAFLEDALAEDPTALAFEGSAEVPGDERAARVLNLIGDHEGGGNYNAVAGKPGNTRDLSKYTLDEILSMQLAARARGVASTAVGKYQVIYPTLKGLKKDLKLTGKEPFDKTLQDKLGYGLLKRRGWDAYVAGDISARTFAYRLSQEFAALPSPETGRSYYAGVGNNKPLVKLSTVYSALGV